MSTGQQLNQNTTLGTLQNSSLIANRTITEGLENPSTIVDKSVTGPSKFLTRKWRDRDLNMHRKHVAEMRAVVQCQPVPPVFINKQKNEQLVEERFTEIERENRLLFEKITHIHLKGAGATLLANNASAAKNRHMLDTINQSISG
jgi:Hemingway/CFA97